MITLFTTRDGDGSAAVEETLNEMCLAHKTVVLDSAADLPADIGTGGEPPVLVDEHEISRGTKAILSHLEELEAFESLWYKFQSDVCYCVHFSRSPSKTRQYSIGRSVSQWAVR